MVKKAATPVKGTPKKSPVKSTATPSKKRGAATTKKTPSKSKGKTIKGQLSSEPDMEKEAEEEAEAEQEVPKSTPKKAAVGKSKAKAKKVETEEVKKEVDDVVAVPSTVLDKAIVALSEFIDSRAESETKKQTLFDDEDIYNFYLQITTSKFLASKPLSKPKSISVPHKLIDEEDFKICLFAKDNVIDSELLEKIEESEIPFLSKIITGKELKGEFKPFEARRKLLSEYDLFLADDHLIPTLPKLLGKQFYEHSQKFPIPVKLYSQGKFSIKTLTNSINKVVSSITYIPPVGVNLLLKIGASSLDKAQLKENAQAVISGLKLQDTNKVRSISLKTVDSPSLPLYYAEKIYTDADVAPEEDTVSKDKKKSAATKVPLDLPVEVPEDVKLTEFEKGLLELAADPADVEKILSRKVKQSQKRKTDDARPAKSAKKQKAKN